MQLAKADRPPVEDETEDTAMQLSTKYRTLMTSKSSINPEELISVCEELLINFPRSAEKLDCLFPIWRLHYDKILAAETALNAHHPPSSECIADFQRRVDEALMHLGRIYERLSRLGSTLYGKSLVYRYWIYRGDCERYRDRNIQSQNEKTSRYDHGEWGPRVSTFQPSLTSYTNAKKILPGHGTAFNQCGIVMESRQDLFLAAYYYMRGMQAPIKPFKKASTNLSKLVRTAPSTIAADSSQYHIFSTQFLMCVHTVIHVKPTPINVSLLEVNRALDALDACRCSRQVAPMLLFVRLVLFAVFLASEHDAVSVFETLLHRLMLWVVAEGGDSSKREGYCEDTAVLAEVVAGVELGLRFVSSRGIVLSCIPPAFIQLALTWGSECADADVSYILPEDIEAKRFPSLPQPADAEDQTTRIAQVEGYLPNNMALSARKLRLALALRALDTTVAAAVAPAVAVDEDEDIVFSYDAHEALCKEDQSTVHQAHCAVLRPDTISHAATTGMEQAFYSPLFSTALPHSASWSVQEGFDVA